MRGARSAGWESDNQHVFDDLLRLSPAEYDEPDRGGHLCLDYLKPDSTSY